jgi:type I restriction enzyme S subunit
MNDFKFVIASEYYSKITDGTHDSPKQKTTGKPLITSKHIKGRNIDFDNAYLISEEDFTKINERSQVEKWDVIISMIGEYCGFSYIERNDNIDYAVKNVGLFKTGSKIESEWLYYYLNSPIGIQFLKMARSGSTQPYLTLNGLRELPILQTKEFKTKTKIIKILSDLDAKIELNNKINAGLEAMAKLIYDYWFVQFDFPNDDGKPYKSSGGKMVWNEELKREIPEGWEVEELKNLTTCLMGQSPKGESYNKDGVGIPLLNGPADYENGSLVGRTYTTEPTRLCMKNDMVLCIRATIGNLTFAEKEFCLGRGVAAVRPNKKEFSELIYYFLLQEIERFKKHATGSIIVGITKDDLIDSLVLLPQIELISQFHKLISPMFSNLRKRKEENLELSKLRDWLLPMLMNEQVKVG